MACGTPIVTSSVNGLEEIAGDAAVLVDPRDPQVIADAVGRVLADAQAPRRPVTEGSRALRPLHLGEVRSGNAEHPGGRGRRAWMKPDEPTGEGRPWIGRSASCSSAAGPVSNGGRSSSSRVWRATRRSSLAGAIFQSPGLSTRAIVQRSVAPARCARAAISWSSSRQDGRGGSFRRRSGGARGTRGDRPPRGSDGVRRRHSCPEVLERVGRSRADLGLVYGSPILRPELFELPQFGTLGIHHGKLPEYRGKKTTFWAMYNGEPSATATIQRITRKLDRGDVVRQGDVPVAGKSYGRVWRELEELGADLYVRAVLDVRDGTARYRSSRRDAVASSIAIRGPAILLRFYWRRLVPGREPMTTNGICILTETYHPVIGGGETQARAVWPRVSWPRAVASRSSRTSRGLSSPSTRRSVACSVRRLPPTECNEAPQQVGTGHDRRTRVATSGVRRAVSTSLLVCGYRVLGIPARSPPCRRLVARRCVLKADSLGEMSGDYFRGGPAESSDWARHVSPVSLPTLALRNRRLRRADRFVAISSAIASELENLRNPRRRRSIQYSQQRRSWSVFDPR